MKTKGAGAVRVGFGLRKQEIKKLVTLKALYVQPTVFKHLLPVFPVAKQVWVL